MCGIAGALATVRDGSQRVLVETIVRDQRPRGPDHEAIESVRAAWGSCILGHNRLAIIDLTPEANMPMWDAARRYAVVFNGEIYNYVELREELRACGARFRTRSDTEVLIESVRCWGIEEAVRRFNGMFAFALLDAAEGRLWLARDRFGVKPLFYVEQPAQLIFASTTPALGRHVGRGPNLAYLARGLSSWVYEDGGSDSAYLGVASLPGGHLLEASCDGEGRLLARVSRWYELEARASALREEIAGAALPELIDRVAGGLDDAVRLRLRADVPIGVSLSGGLDSSTVAATLAREHHEVIGFTFGHPDDAGSEGRLATELGRHGNVEIDYVWPSTDALRETLWTALEAQDAPFPGGAILAQYHVFHRARERGVKVVLGGQGGDEAFMGYRKYPIFLLLRLLRERRLGRFARLGTAFLPMLLAELPQLGRYWTLRYRYGGKGPAEAVLRLPAPAPAGLGDEPGRALWRRQAADVTRFSLPTLLRYEDRNSMGNSVESRLPFLDYRLVELGLALPDDVKLRHGYGKWIVREVARGLIPETIRSARYKRGFSVSQERWIREGLGDEIRAGLARDWARLGEFVVRDADPRRAYTDERLCRDPRAFGEAMTLLWCVRRLP